MTDAEATIRHSILNGIAETGTTYVRGQVDISPLVDAIFRSLTDDAVIWSLREYKPVLSGSEQT
jgi:hypothetical protein